MLFQAKARPTAYNWWLVLARAYDHKIFQCSKQKLQLTKINKLFLCSSVLAPRVQRANRATRKKLNIETDKVKSMTTPVKAPWESRRIEENLARKSQVKLRLATVNVGSMVGRSAEVTETIRRNVDVVALQEV